MVGIALALGAMWGTIVYFLANSREADIKAEQRVLERMVHSVEEQTHHLVSLLDYFLVSTDLWFQDHPDADPLSDPRFLKLVAVFRAKTGGLVEIRLVSAEGGLHYLGKPTPEPLADVKDRDYFQAQIGPGSGGLFIAKPVVSRVTGLWGLPISHPLRSRPRNMAVIFAAIENRVLAQPFEMTRTHPNGSILLAHRNGTILFRSPDDGSIGKSLAGGWLWTKELPRRSSGVYQVEEGIVDRRPRVVAFTDVPDYPLVVAASSALDDVLAGWHRKVWNNLLIGAAMTVVGLFVLWRLLASLKDLEEMRLKLEEQANMDFLTGIPSRRFFMNFSERELARATRYGHPLSVLMLDLDHFKNVNDRHGHEMGDRALKAVTSAIQDELRTTDLQGRMGGEEFCVLLPETRQEEAQHVAERVRVRVEGLCLRDGRGQAVSVTLSVGVAQFRKGEEDLDHLLGRADGALYQAKQAGRNRVRAAGGDGVPPEAPTRSPGFG